MNDDDSRRQDLPNFKWGKSVPLDYTEVRTLSKCHKWRRGWTPEPGSPAAERPNPKQVGYVIPKGRAYHLKDSPCVHVQGKFAFMNKDRHLSWKHFGLVQQGERCKNCQQYYAR